MCLSRLLISGSRAVDSAVEEGLRIGHCLYPFLQFADARENQDALASGGNSTVF